MRNVTTFDYYDFVISSTSLSSLLFSMLFKRSVSRKTKQFIDITFIQGDFKSDLQTSAVMT